MTQTIQTIQNKIVQRLRGAEIETAVLDARVLLQYVLGCSLEELLLRRDDDFPIELGRKLDQLVEKRFSGMPIAKIICQKEFWGLNFKTTTDTLDPRPDSETLIEAVLSKITDRDAPCRILDLGTGTGCLLIALLSGLPNAAGVGVDINAQTLSVAQENAQNLGVGERSKWLVSDWFEGVEGEFDIIISNPPYIPSADIEGLAVDVREFDPMRALDGGDDGLDPYRIIADQAEKHLSSNGMIAVEMGIEQHKQVQAIFESQMVCKTEIHKDLGGIERCLIFKK